MGENRPGPICKPFARYPVVSMRTSWQRDQKSAHVSPVTWMHAIRSRHRISRTERASTMWRMVHENSTYDIPLRTLCSKDTPNLFVGGRLTDGDSYAGGSLRVMGTSFGTGHAAGVAAAVYAQSQGSEYIFVQKELVRQNAHLKLDQ